MLVVVEPTLQEHTPWSSKRTSSSRACRYIREQVAPRGARGRGHKLEGCSLLAGEGSDVLVVIIWYCGVCSCVSNKDCGLNRRRLGNRRMIDAQWTRRISSVGQSMKQAPARRKWLRAAAERRSSGFRMCTASTATPFRNELQDESGGADGKFGSTRESSTVKMRKRETSRGT